MLTEYPIAALRVQGYLHDGESISEGDDLLVINAPGHCAGQVALIWQKNGGVLIAADAAANIGQLSYPRVVEDFDEAKRTLAKLAALDFEVAVFGHGEPLVSSAQAAFRAEWMAPDLSGR